MKIKNFLVLAGAAAALTACMSASDTVEPIDLNEQRVFFAFNSSDISADAKENLKAQAAYLNANPDIKIQIAGNCDERGSAEYNLALGARRANAAKSVIVSNGVDASRVSTISYGKERPLVPGNNEDAWRWNRNAATTIK